MSKQIGLTSYWSGGGGVGGHQLCVCGADQVARVVPEEQVGEDS